MLPTRFHFSALILVYSVFLYTEVYAEVFFFENDMVIHSKKNINNFYVNLEALNQLIQHIKGSIAYFKKKELKSPPSKKKAVIDFSVWLQIEAGLCAKSIEMKKEKALEISKNNLPDEIHKHVERTKRGFKPLGSLISFFSGLPSPSSWENYSHLVDRLRQIVIGNSKESHTISSTIKDITNTTRLLSEEYENLTKKTWSMDSKLESFTFYLHARHKLIIICKEAEMLSDSLIDEARAMDEIRRLARHNQPSENLFPLSKIKEKIRTLEKEQKNAFPLFRSEHDMEHIYAMASCITTIDKNVIHSVVSIPLINFNTRYQFIDPTLNETELEIIQQLSKLAHQPIDHILCAKDHQLKVLSTSKLQRCLRTKNGIFFCQEREIVHFKHDSNRCSKLPESIIVQLHSHKILLKTNLDHMNIICGDIEKQVPLKGTYNIIEINPNCKVITKDFKIDEIKDREDLELHAEPFRVVSFPALDNPSYLDFKELKERHDKLKVLTDKIHSSQRKMDEDLGKNEVNDKLNQERVNDIEENEGKTYVKTWAFGGLTIAGLVIGFFISMTVICKKIKFRKWTVSAKEKETETSEQKD